MADDRHNVPKLSARQVTMALRNRFEPKHVVFTEVKDGATYGRLHRRLDLVAIKKTWTPVTILCAEVKVSRSDFLRDDKWPEYMALCNKFYWACPKGLIKPDEIDTKCGLIYAYNEARCRVVKKALYRVQSPDTMLLLYLILWRADLSKSSRKQNMAAILEEMNLRKEIGDRYAYHVSTQLREAERVVVEAKQDRKRVRLAATATTIKAKLVLDWCAENDVRDYELRRLLDDITTARGVAQLKDTIGDVGERLVALAHMLKADATGGLTE